MERLVRLVSVLHAAGEAGVAATTLYGVAGFEGADPGTQLAKEFRHLREQGWRIDNIAGQGEEGRYQLVSGDNRLRLRLTARQQAALHRAVLLADRDDLARKVGLEPGQRRPDISAEVLLAGHGADLAMTVRAVRDRCLLRFRYKGSERAVHPASLKHQNGQWYLSGVEDGVLKHFVAARMSGVSADRPGTADRTEAVRRLALHPLSWPVDKPIDVVLQAEVDFVPDLERWLERPRSRVDDSGVAELTYTVTNRTAFRARLYMLGTRVRVVGPDRFRDELLAELSEMAGEA